MADLLSAGDDRPPRRPPWLLPSAAVAVVAVVAGIVALRQHPAATPAAPEATRPPATTPASPSGVGLPPWPTAPAACGGEASLPLLSTRPLRQGTGLSVLVGGAGLRRVAVDTGRAVALSEAPVTALASSAAGVHAVQVRCGRRMSFQHGTVLAVAGDRVSEVPGLRADGLLSAPDATWAYTYPADPTARPMTLRRVDDGRPVHLPLGFYPDAATHAAFLGSVATHDAAGAGSEPASVSRTDPTDVHRLGDGVVAAASDAVTVLGRPDCDGTAPCVLTRYDTDGRRSYRLPRGRTPTSAFVLSPDDRRLAFQLARAEPDPRYETGHPGAPSDVVVLDLTTGRLSVVPGIELAPKSSAGLAFGPDSRWLVITLNEGRRTGLLVWREGLDRPLASPARLPGLVLYNAPVLALH